MDRKMLAHQGTVFGGSGNGVVFADDSFQVFFGVRPGYTANVFAEVNGESMVCAMGAVLDDT
jgi:phage repressor protein C with HTH and peptisase S24 domain